MDIDRQILSAVPQSLELKNGARVMFTANDYPGNRAARQLHHKQEGLLNVNGLTSVIFGANENGTVTVHTDNVKTDRGRSGCPPCLFLCRPGGRLVKVKVATWYQIPLCPAYAMTFHRCQGQTLPAVHVNPPTFGPGQFYVGVSRCTSLGGLFLSRPVAPRDLIMDPAAEAFYRSLENAGNVHKRKKARKDCLIWVPQPLKEHVQREIALESTGIPAAYPRLERWYIDTDASLLW